ncbi:restriction modification system DNA specificity subunit [Dietzia sp. UCD-THP]|nr:restriction modification system DNA specificity subunit [Dietzia sp. UCD-THP]
MPSEIEQRAIADFLNRETAKIDALIDKQDQLIATMREDRAATITHAVTKGLTPGVADKPSGIQWMGDVPAHWEVARLRHHATMKTGHTPSRQEPEFWENTHIPWFTLADVWQLRRGRQLYLGETAGKISSLGLANSAAELLPAGTVILSRTASVGFSGIMPIPMATSQDFWNWICGTSLVPEFLAFVFRAMKPYFDSLMMGSTHQTIYQADAAAIQIPLPPVDEQTKIVEALKVKTSTVDSLIDKSTEMIDVLREYRSALITNAVTGKIDVREAV